MATSCSSPRPACCSGAGNADYPAANSALAFGFARTLKNEIVRIAPRGRVNVVAPGWTVTAAAAVTDELVEAATQTMPLKKIATREKWLGPSSGSLRPSTLHTAAVRSSR
jgi:NAD(P)-dependent dehydrogenase (short-subunit alcohol dehydrogenase family)